MVLVNEVLMFMFYKTRCVEKKKHEKRVVKITAEAITFTRPVLNNAISIHSLDLKKAIKKC